MTFKFNLFIRKIKKKSCSLKKKSTLENQLFQYFDPTFFNVLNPSGDIVVHDAINESQQLPITVKRSWKEG